ncbi:MAG: OmpH family outer membrane protein [Proteobacteria bacterium]|nr:OmpH family outer membrane protein [Pseudomonadota bacterium]
MAAGFLFGAAPGGVTAAFAQQSPGYFIPPSARPAPQQRPTQRVAPRPAQVPAAEPVPGPGAEAEAPPPPLNVELPPSPPLPPLEKGVPPPAAVMGVLDVPQVLHASTAYQEVEKVIGARRQKLNEDAQAEQTSWRDLQQQLSNGRGNLSAEQVRTKEKDLQERITEAQRKFRDRNRIIQEAGQYALAQIDRALNQVVQQVALGRGMNLVLHRAQVALNMPEFDISDQVAAQLNKMLPSVIIPPDGVSVSAMKPGTNGLAAGVPPVGTPQQAEPAKAAAPGAPKSK